jgi:hypothetical protein
MAFSAAVKTSALNWPHRRGTATAFPLAAFGLSAFFFSTVGSLLFPGDPSAFLELLAWGTCGLTFGGFFFLKVHPQSPSPANYHAVPGSDGLQHGRVSSQHTRNNSSDEPKPYRSANAIVEPGTSSNSNRNSTSSNSSPLLFSSDLESAPASPSRAPDYPPDPTAVPGIPSEPGSGRVVADENPEDPEASETSSLMSRPTSLVGDASFVGNHIDLDLSHRTDIRGLKLLRSLEFWQLFAIMAILSGVGIMTIKFDSHSWPDLLIHADIPL